MAGLGWIGAADLIAIMDTCGVTSAIPRWGNEGIAETFLGIDSGASFSWQHDAVSAAGGNYRLCWYGASLLANRSVTLQDSSRQTRECSSANTFEHILRGLSVGNSSLWKPRTSLF